MDNRMTSTALAVDSFAPTIVLGQQSVDAELLGKIGEHKVRVTIKSDSYDFQSYARIHVWRPASLDWSLVYSLPYQRMKTPRQLCYLPNRRGLDKEHFRADTDELMATARAILVD